GRPFDREAVDVARDAVGKEPGIEHRPRRPEAERAAAVADIEYDAALARRHHLLTHPATRLVGRVRVGAEAVGEDVALAQGREHLVPARRRIVEMGHDRQPRLLGDLERHVERRYAGGAAGAAPDPDLDADDEIAILFGDPSAFAEIEQTDVGALADHDRGREG